MLTNIVPIHTVYDVFRPKRETLTGITIDENETVACRWRGVATEDGPFAVSIS